jgi:hypothetical protein
MKSVHARGEGHLCAAAGNDTAVALKGAINNDSPVADVHTVVATIVL